MDALFSTQDAGQRNRLKPGARNDLVRCRGSGEPLAPATGPMASARWITLVAAILAGLSGYLVSWPEPSPLATRHAAAADVPKRAAAGHAARGLSDVVTLRYSSSIRATTTSRRPGRAAAVLEAPIVPVSGLIPGQPVAISTGLVRARSGRERIAPLEVRTSSGHNYFIRLMNITEGKEELAIYIEGGRSFATDVPLGTYQILYAAGQVWYGEPQYFGADTVCFEADKQFDFYQAADTINGHTIELILQVGGDLKATRIDPSRC